MLDPATGPLPHRVAATLLLLLAQPVSRITELHVDDVVIDLEHDETGLRLGDDVTPVPEPFGALLRQLIDERPNLNTAANNAKNPWLFPGRRPGAHRTPNGLRDQIKALGVESLLAARNGALRQLVIDCPPPLVAEMLGYTYGTTDRHALHAGSPWLTYAALRSDQHS